MKSPGAVTFTHRQRFSLHRLLAMSVLCTASLLPLKHGNLLQAPAKIAQPADTPGPLHVQGNLLLNTHGKSLLLRGAQIEGFNVVHPVQIEREALARLNSRTFTVMHRDWHMNVVRLPLSDFLWQQDPSKYLATVSGVVQEVNAAGMYAVLDLHEDARAGVPETSAAVRLPTPLASSFWQAVAANFRSSPGVIFDVYNEPTVRMTAAPRGRGSPRTKAPPGLNATDWQLWLRGGVVDSHTYVGMQDLVNSIRSAGARQIVVVEGLQAAHSFVGMGAGVINDPNVMYSVHPYFARYRTRSAWNTAFGFLAGRYPLFAGEWGLIPNGFNSANCARVPPDQATALVTDLLNYFQERSVSWSVYAFMVPKLIQNYQQYTPTTLSVPWRCGDQSNQHVGIGEIVKVYLSSVQ